MKNLVKILFLMSFVGSVICTKQVTLIDKPLHSWENRKDLKVVEQRWWKDLALDDVMKSSDGFRLKEREVKKVIYYPLTDKVVIFYLDK